jgi:protein-S-isoprenylcysteine O-methyltransferase Ste14
MRETSLRRPLRPLARTAAIVGTGRKQGLAEVGSGASCAFRTGPGAARTAAAAERAFHGRNALIPSRFGPRVRKPLRSIRYRLRLQTFADDPEARTHVALAPTKSHDFSTLADFGERALIAVLFAHLAAMFLPAIAKNWSPLDCIILFVEFLIVALVLARRRTGEVTRHPRDWTVALLGTCASLLAVPAAPAPMGPEALCLAVALFGLALQLSAKLFLNARFGIVAANRGVQSGGPFGLIRHPIYCGYTITHVGFLLYAPSLWNLTVYVLAFGLQVWRIFIEERLLMRDPAYEAFTRRVPYRLVPGVF